jgi:hypothetical protein
MAWFKKTEARYNVKRLGDRILWHCQPLAKVWRCLKILAQVGALVPVGCSEVLGLQMAKCHTLYYLRTGD